MIAVVVAIVVAEGQKKKKLKLKLFPQPLGYSWLILSWLVDDGEKRKRMMMIVRIRIQ